MDWYFIAQIGAAAFVGWLIGWYKGRGSGARQYKRAMRIYQSRSRPGLVSDRPEPVRRFESAESRAQERGK